MSQLEDLLQQCVVKLTLPGHLGWGTGFFVAPGWILTCAHVVQDARDEFVQVRWQRQENWAQATVEQLLADPFDLALLKVTGSTEANLPCVYFDEEIRSRDPLYLFGYPDQDFPNGCPVTFNCEGLTGDESALIKFALGQVRPGMSGSPLLNQRTGKVCGIVKFTRDRSFDLGGGAIPTQVILEQFPELRELQREFHGRERHWINLITTPTGIDFQPYLHAILTDDDYQEWQEVYTPTTVEDRRRIPEQVTAPVSQRRFSSRLKLRAETVKPDKAEQGDQRRAQESQERVEQWDVLAGLRNYATEHVVLIGKPGSGKSTSLERLLWEEAEKALQDPNARIPVLVKLRRCTGSIEALIRDFLVGHQVALELVQIEELLRQGRFLLLLDGLNELPKAFETEAANFRDRYRRTTPMIVSTRDLGGGGTLGIEKTLKMLHLTEPQMREFVRGYLAEEGDRLFQQLQGDRLRKFAETPLLLWMLCRVFAHNGKVPDNLGLAFREFVQLHDQELQSDAPADSRDQWHKLLRHLAFIMMQGKTLIDPELSVPREEAEDCLTAYLQQEDRANPRESAEQWLKDLLKYHLIQPVIQPNFEEHIEFRHQLIQEYYTAEYLLRLLPNLTNNQIKQDYLNYLKWTEPVALMLALMDEEAQALRVVKLAMDEVDLMLGARLSGEVRPTFQATTVSWIDAKMLPIQLKIQCWEASRSDIGLSGLLSALKDADGHVRARAAEVLGNIGYIKAISGLLDALKDHDWNVQRKAVEAVGKIGDESAIPHLIEILDDPSSKIFKDVVGALAVIGGERVVDGLVKSLRYGIRTSSTYTLAYRPVDDSPLIAISALEKIGGKRSIFGLIEALEHVSHNVSQRALEALKVTNGKDAVSDLLEVIDSSSNRYQVIRALGAIGSKKAVPSLIEALKDRSWVIRGQAAVSLGDIGSEAATSGLLEVLSDSERVVSDKALTALVKIGSKKILPELLELLSDENHDVRRQAAYLLGAIKCDNAIPDLLKALDDENPIIRSSAASALGKIGSEAATPRLLRSLDDKDSRVRASVASALGKIGSLNAISGLFKAIEDPNYDVGKEVVNTLSLADYEKIGSKLLESLEHSESFVRWRAAHVLEKIADETAIPGLLNALANSDKSTRCIAASALGRIGHKIAIPGLIEALEDQDSYIREMAVLAIQKISDERAIPGLLKALNDSRSDIPPSAVVAIGNVGNEAAIPGLFEALMNSNESVRWLAASALGKIGHETAIPGLLKALNDKSSKVREQAASALGKIGHETAIPGLLAVLDDESYRVRGEAVLALGKIGSEIAIPSLVKGLNDQDSGIRWRTAQSLGDIGSEIAIPNLLKSHKDSDDAVRRRVFSALEKLGNSSLVRQLWDLYTTGEEEFFPVITTIQNRCQFYNYELWQAHLATQKSDRSQSQSRDRPATYEVNAEIVQIVENNYGTIHGKQTP